MTVGELIKELGKHDEVDAVEIAFLYGENERYQHLYNFYSVDHAVGTVIIRMARNGS